MGPYADHAPTVSSQTFVGITVAKSVGNDLVSPKFSISPRPRRVFGTSMPEAPVYEHSDSDAAKRNVGRSSGIRNDRYVNPIAHAAPVELAS